MKKAAPWAAVVLTTIGIFGCSSAPGTRNPPPVPPPAADATPPGGASKAVDICETLMFPPQPPAGPPAIKPAGESVRVLAFGDYGDGKAGQKAVADAMKKQKFDFGVTLGDNFYDTGLPTATDTRWKTDWEDMYGGLGIRLYASLGNHDYYDPASPIAEALYSLRSKSWCFPASYYTYTAGPVQFFVLDTDWIMRASQKDQDKDPIEAQQNWLTKQLTESKSTWKVVYGHHPVYTTGQHQVDPPSMIDQILPVLKGRADVYIAGHDHDMQYLKPEGGVQFFVSGAGGHKLRELGPDNEKRLVWGIGKMTGFSGGFSVLEADASSLTVKFFNTKNEQLCSVKLVKGKAADVNCPKP